MLKGRGRDPRAGLAPAHLSARSPAPAPGVRQPAHSPTHLSIRTPTLPRAAPLAKPEPDYEVVEFPSEQYVNAKLQPPPPPPPRPPTGHPAEAASCGLCGGGGARVRCAECGRRALCASCDDMYHRHPKRRHHQRQALSLNQIRDERPPLPPKGTPPVPPPRRHKMSGDRMSASPRPPSAEQRAPLASLPTMHTQTMPLNNRMSQNAQQIPPHLQSHLQGKLGGSTGSHIGSMPYLSSHHGAPAGPPAAALGLAPPWQRPRTSLPGFNMPPNVQPMPAETWEAPEAMMTQSWGRPLRRGASVLELGGNGHMGGCAGCAGGAGGAGGWRYGSCASLEQQAWSAWPAPPCCHPPHAHAHPAHVHAPYTPQPYRRADSRAASRAASRAGSRAASPAMSVRSRASRRNKHRTPSPPPLPSSDADSESESDHDRPPHKEQPALQPNSVKAKPVSDDWGPREPVARPAAVAAPAARAPWQCEHCTFVNEAGVRVCAVCCRTPTAAPRELPPEEAERACDTESPRPRGPAERPSVAESARSVAESARGIEKLDLREQSPPPSPQHSRKQQNGEAPRVISKKERVSTGCGPSPPREETVRKPNNRLVTPTREPSVDSTRTRHDMAVGSSPPREVITRTSMARSPPTQNTLVRPQEEVKRRETPTRHSISVGPSPPRDYQSPVTVQKKSAGTSPPRERVIEGRPARGTVSNTGTSPPPQTISTQTYEVPSPWERAPSAARARSRRRQRDEGRRERSHSRHSLSSDTRESERSARTSGGGGGGSGRWEWRSGRDSSPGAEWSGSERRPQRLARRASHLDLRRDRHPPARRNSFYRSEAASPEPSRAMSLEALAGRGAGAAAERGLELARLMADAERLGFSAAEVQAALAQSPAAPLSWLRERWPSLCAGVRAAAARLAPRARVSELEARAALARHRGAMWPAVTECVERHRRQAEKESGPRQHGGRVWGAGAGADDDAAPPARADSSDEFDGPPPTGFRDDDWMYLPLDAAAERDVPDEWDPRPADLGYREVASDVALELSRLLVQAGVPAISDDIILNGLLSDAPPFPADKAKNVADKPNSVDFIQSENDFIDAYNALTRSTPLPSVDDRPVSETPALSEKDTKRDTYDVNENNLHSNTGNAIMTTSNNINNKLIAPTNEAIDITNAQPNIIRDEQFPTIHNVSDYAQQQNTLIPSYRKQNSIPEKEELLNQIRNVSNSQLNVSVENDYSQQQNTPIPSYHKQNSMPVKDELLNEVRNVSNTQTNVSVELNTKEVIEEIATNHFEESLSSVSSNAARVKEKEDFSLKQSPEKELHVSESVDKTSNLNDIVGNTQRLIQQMKDEINSDINYIDKDTSQSEPDSSESDISSEHESSYSDTEEKETDDLSSNESETASSESEGEHLHERRPTIIHRTSSEENDQFEEAMDHIEDQMEDFKNTNIEILDSIARSLQEEHTISVEVDAQKNDDDDEGQDLNNNLFVEVNSFEEIYAEINTSKKVSVSKNAASNMQNDKNNIGSIKQVGIPQKNISKQPITIYKFEDIKPIKPLISDVYQNILHAIESGFIDVAEVNVSDMAEEHSKVENNLVNGNNNDISEHNSSNSSDEEGSLDSAESQNGTVDHQFRENLSNPEMLDESKMVNNPFLDNNIENITQENITEITIVDSSIGNSIDINQETRLESIEHNSEIENTIEQTLSNVDIVQQNLIIEDNTEKEILIQDTDIINIVKENNLEDIVTVENINDNVQSNVVKESSVPISKENHLLEDNIQIRDDIQINNDNKTEKDMPKLTTLDTAPATKETQNSPSKSPPNSPTDVNTNKTFNSNKSNIPKLVKVVQNNKQKGDKSSPKVVASKVPIRRASLKQYPAPTPPKAHFGNVQSGHVKQLQTRLFNNKFPKTVVNVPDVIDVKPSTSTMHKKKPAPPPPSSNQKPDVKEATPPKEKKNSFFRESCRTEDEWTESEAEDAPPPAPKEALEPSRQPSPPPPVTVRRISGQIIDLASVRLPEGSPERQARMLLAEGASETWEQAVLAVELASRGAELPAALLAALECADLPQALAYLHQECELCASRLPEHEMVSMLRCTHRCCGECARLYFTVQITERSIADCVCPYCKEPDLEGAPEDAWLEYFAHLDILLKTLLDADVHELFQRKLRDRTLARDPNFRWCVECSSGFFVHPKQKKIRCPECKSVSCAKCRKTWSVNHEGVSCERYAAWLDDNDPERSLAAVQQHLRENGLECPRCHFKYSLSRGGCMHFTCTQCKYEFCYGCGKPFMMGARCGLSEYCARLGLHAHHPRNCLFYLRDKEPHELQTLLQMNNVAYETDAPKGSTNRCPIQLQRETPTGLVDGICGSDVPPKHAGLCKPHYVEYLAGKARALDPIPIMDVAELVAELRRRALPLPERGPWDTDPVYAGMCAEIVREKIPLE